MRPTSAYTKLVTSDTTPKQDSANSKRTKRPCSSYTTRNRVLKSGDSAYHSWLRRSNEFNYNVKKHPRDHNSVQTFNLRSGCKVIKSASHLQVRIDPDEFFDPKPPRPVEPHIPVKTMEILIAGLQEQVRYLTVYLEEEKLHHAGTKKRANVDVEKAKAEMKNLHGKEIDKVLQNHVKFIEEMKTEHAQQLEELEEELKAHYNKLEKEYKMLQASFKNYRDQISDEMNKKWDGKKREYEWEKQRAVDSAVDNTRRAMEERFNKERISIRNEYKELMQQMMADQRKEMEEFMRKMSDGKSSIEELRAKADQAEELERELKETKEALQIAKRDIIRITHELNETLANLSVYENKFQEKVDAVEDKYRKRIDDLVTEVSDFRILLIRKAETLCKERATADELQKKWTQLAKAKLEERIFSKRNAFITFPVEIAKLSDTLGESGAGDSDHESAMTQSSADEITNGMRVPKRTADPVKERPKSSSLSPKKHPTTKRRNDAEVKKDIGITRGRKDEIRPRLSLSKVSLLDTANLPYVDDIPTPSHGAATRSTSPRVCSRSQSPDVIY